VSIFVLNSEDSNFSALSDSLVKYVELEEFDDEKELFNSLSEEGDAVLLNLDDQIKKKDKLIKKLKAKYDDLPIFVLCNSLEPKKMAKHQNSKFGAHLYFRTPVDEEMLLDLLSEYFEIDASISEKPVIPMGQLETIHNEKTNVGIEAEGASSSLDDAMSSVFVEEYSEAESTDGSENIIEEPLSDISLDHGSDDVEEFSMDNEDVGLSLDDNNSDFNIESNDSSEDGALDLGGEDMSLEADLSLGEDEDETIFPDEDDLEFPEPTKTNVQISEELSLSEQSDEVTPNIVEDDDFSFDVDDSLDLAVSDAGEEVESVSMDGGEINLDQDSGQLVVDEDISSDEPAFDLGKEDENIDEVTVEAASSDDDFGLEFGLDEEEDDLGLGLSADSVTDLDEEMVVADKVTDNEITRPISTAQLEGLNLDEVVTVDEPGDLSFSIEDDSDVDEQESETLLDVGGNLPESPDLDDLSFGMDSDDDTATIVGVAIDGVNESLEGEDLLNLSEDDALPEFSDTVERKIQEIDEMLVEEQDVEELLVKENLPDAPKEFVYSALEEDDEEEEATRVFSASDVEAMPEEHEEDEEEEKTKVFTAENLSNLEKDYAKPSESQIYEHKEYVKSHDDELIRLGETIKTLREDRDHWMSVVSEHEEKKETEKKDFLNIQAQLDESKIEIAIMKKRFSKQHEELKYQLDLSDDRKEALLVKNKQFEQEVETLNKKTKVDVHQVRARERELEEKLEMLKADAEIQIKNRDLKNLELKRRIDTLEFDIESSHAKEQKTNTGKNDLEDKMERVIQTLRSAINHLEDDQGNDERMRRIKKSLDV
jgi:hypothetical protein